MDKKSLGRHFQKQREKLKISQEKLSEAIGISPMYYSSIERGVRSPSLELFIKIANALAMSADEALEDMLGVGCKVRASRLSELIEPLPAEDKKQVLAVVETMIESKKA